MHAHVQTSKVTSRGQNQWVSSPNCLEFMAPSLQHFVLMVWDPVGTIARMTVHNVSCMHVCKSEVATFV